MRRFLLVTLLLAFASPALATPRALEDRELDTITAGRRGHARGGDFVRRSPEARYGFTIVLIQLNITNIIQIAIGNTGTVTQTATVTQTNFAPIDLAALQSLGILRLAKGGGWRG